jgi:uncharacterized membrane protein
MNGAHWHLVLNHLPIIIPVIALIIMLGGIILKSNILKRTAYFFFMVSAMTAIATFSTGEEAEEVVEKIQGIDENLIKIHEETSEIFAILLYVLGGISMLGLWANWKEKSFSNVIMFVTLAMSLIVLFYAQQTGTTGGEIRHTEIRVENSSSINVEKDDD